MAKKGKYKYVFAEDRSRHLGKKLLLGVIVTLLLLGLLILAYNFAQNNQVRLLQQRVTVGNLPENLEGYSILHLSDLQGRTLGNGQGHILRAIQNVTYHAVVMTGDMIGKSGDPGPVLSMLHFFANDVPIILIPGDEDTDYLDAAAHGTISPFSDWAEKLTQAGVFILDRPVMFTRGSRNPSRIWFIPENIYQLDLDSLEHTWQGVETRLSSMRRLNEDQAAELRVAKYHLTRISEIRQSIKEIKPTDIQVVLTHIPISDEYGRTLMAWTTREDAFSIRSAAVVLSGHTCGGQWRLPGGGPIWMPEEGWFPDEHHASGMSWVNSIPQYISPGLSTSSIYPFLKIRLFNPPSITRVILTSQAR